MLTNQFYISFEVSGAGANSKQTANTQTVPKPFTQVSSTTTAMHDDDDDAVFNAEADNDAIHQTDNDGIHHHHHHQHMEGDDFIQILWSAAPQLLVRTASLYELAHSKLKIQIFRVHPGNADPSHTVVDCAELFREVEIPLHDIWGSLMHPNTPYHHTVTLNDENYNHTNGYAYNDFAAGDNEDDEELARRMASTRGQVGMIITSAGGLPGGQLVGGVTTDDAIIGAKPIVFGSIIPGIELFPVDDDVVVGVDHHRSSNPAWRHVIDTFGASYFRHVRAQVDAWKQPHVHCDDVSTVLQDDDMCAVRNGLMVIKRSLYYDNVAKVHLWIHPEAVLYCGVAESVTASERGGGGGMGSRRTSFSLSTIDAASVSDLYLNLSSQQRQRLGMTGVHPSVLSRMTDMMPLEDEMQIGGGVGNGGGGFDDDDADDGVGTGADTGAGGDVDVDPDGGTLGLDQHHDDHHQPHHHGNADNIGTTTAAAADGDKGAGEEGAELFIENHDGTEISIIHNSQGLMNGERDALEVSPLLDGQPKDVSSVENDMLNNNTSPDGDQQLNDENVHAKINTDHNNQTTTTITDNSTAANTTTNNNNNNTNNSSRRLRSIENNSNNRNNNSARRRLSIENHHSRSTNSLRHRISIESSLPRPRRGKRSDPSTMSLPASTAATAGSGARPSPDAGETHVSNGNHPTTANIGSLESPHARIVEMKWSYLPRESNLPGGGVEGHTLTAMDHGHAALRFGGAVGMGRVRSNVLQRVDAHTLHWREVKTYGVPPDPRTGHGAVALGDDQSRLLVFGGTGKQGARNDLHMFHNASATWSPVVCSGEAPGERARMGMTVNADGSNVYVFGGRSLYRSLGGRYYDVDGQVHLFDANRSQWITLSLPHHHGGHNKQTTANSAINSSSHVFPQPRSGCVLQFVNGRHLILHGGYDDGDKFFDDTMIFDTISHEWIPTPYPSHQLQQDHAHPHRPAGRESHAHAFLPDHNALVVCGGDGRSSMLSDVQVFDASMMQWLKQPSMVGHGPGCNTGAAMTTLFDSRVLFTGGEDGFQARNAAYVLEVSHRSVLDEHTLTDVARQRGPDAPMCVVCLDAEPEVVFLWCGHSVCCASCAKLVNRTCPICRKTFSKIVYRSFG